MDFCSRFLKGVRTPIINIYISVSGSLNYEEFQKIIGMFSSVNWVDKSKQKKKTIYLNWNFGFYFFIEKNRISNDSSKNYIFQF